MGAAENLPKEIIDEFCNETDELIVELDMILEKLEEDSKNSSDLEKFGQIIDRIMGASRSLALEEIAQFCELGKLIGYKAGQITDKTLVNVVVAVLFDTTYLLKKMVEHLKSSESKALDKLNTKAFVSRLKWLSEKFKHIERQSCAVGHNDSSALSQNSIDDLMKSLGL